MKIHGNYYYIRSRSIFERVLNGRFSKKKIDEKSLFSVLVIEIWCGTMQKKKLKKSDAGEINLKKDDLLYSLVACTPL